MAVKCTLTQNIEDEFDELHAEYIEGDGNSSSTPNNKREPLFIYFMTGNPGAVRFYKDFITQLVTRLRCAAWACGHKGHCRKGRQVYGISSQVLHHEKNLKAIVKQHKYVLVMAHSIGGYILTEVMKSLDEETTSNFIGCCLLCPALTMFSFPTRVALSLTQYKVIKNVVFPLLSQFPVLRHIFRVNQEVFDDITDDRFIANALCMAKEELEVLPASVPEDFFSLLPGIPMFFLYASSDVYVPFQAQKKMKQLLVAHRASNIKKDDNCFVTSLDAFCHQFPSWPDDCDIAVELIVEWMIHGKIRSQTLTALKSHCKSEVSVPPLLEMALIPKDEKETSQADAYATINHLNTRDAEESKTSAQ